MIKREIKLPYALRFCAHVRCIYLADFWRFLLWVDKRYSWFITPQSIFVLAVTCDGLLSSRFLPGRAPRRDELTGNSNGISYPKRAAVNVPRSFTARIPGNRFAATTIAAAAAATKCVCGLDVYKRALHHKDSTWVFPLKRPRVRV